MLTAKPKWRFQDENPKKQKFSNLKSIEKHEKMLYI